MIKKNYILLILTIITLFYLGQCDYCRDRFVSETYCGKDYQTKLASFNFPSSCEFDEMISSKIAKCISSYENWEQYNEICSQLGQEGWVMCEYEKTQNSKNLRILSPCQTYGFDICQKKETAEIFSSIDNTLKADSDCKFFYNSSVRIDTSNDFAQYKQTWLNCLSKINNKAMNSECKSEIEKQQQCVESKNAESTPKFEIPENANFTWVKMTQDLCYLEKFNIGLYFNTEFSNLGLIHGIYTKNQTSIDEIMKRFSVSNHNILNEQDQRELIQFPNCIQQVAENEDFLEPYILYYYQTENVDQECEPDISSPQVVLSSLALQINSFCEIGIGSNFYAENDLKLYLSSVKFCYYDLIKFANDLLQCEQQKFVAVNYDKLPDSFTDKERNQLSKTQNLAETCFIYFQRGEFDQMHQLYFVHLMQSTQEENILQLIKLNESEKVYEAFEKVAKDLNQGELSSIKQPFLNYGKCLELYLKKYEELRPIVRSSPFLKNHFIQNECLSSTDNEEKMRIQNLIDIDQDCEYAMLKTPELLSDPTKLKENMQKCFEKLNQAATTTKCKEYIQKQTTEEEEEKTNSSIISPIFQILFIVSIIIMI